MMRDACKAAVLAAAALLAACAAEAAPLPAPGLARPPERELWLTHRCAALGRAVTALSAEYGDRYGRGGEYASVLGSLSNRLARAADAESPALVQALAALRDQALRDHPLVRDLDILVVRRRPKDMKTERRRVPNPDQRISFNGEPGREIGYPSNHECNSSLERDGYDNEIAVLSFRGGAPARRTLYRPPDGGYVGEADLDWDARRLLFTKSNATGWRVCEVNADGSGFRQVSNLPEDVDCFDACYLPDGGIVFGSTATFQSVPCWHGLKRVSNLYRMESDRRTVRQLCFDQDHDLHPVVLANGQVLYSRWDYTGISHIYLRMLMAMNPDGTGQRAVYGSNSWFPNALYFPRELPGQPGSLVSILSGYHGPCRMGQLVLIDTARGHREAEGIVRRISGENQPVTRVVRDNLVGNDWPKFLTPYPLDAAHVLVSAKLAPGAPWALCLADAHDNVAVLHADPDYALLEPVPLAPRPRPPVLPSRVDTNRTDALVYLQDVYTGPGLAGVPRGTVKRLRLVAYHFGYLNMAGPDKVGRGGPWEVMRIVGTVPVEADGSAFFRVPANTPLAFQALDAEGKAVQLMRSWYTAMPGEYVSCAGCHEPPPQAAPSLAAVAARRAPCEVAPWRGPARGFDFAREVQPVLDRHCVSCHDGSSAAVEEFSDTRTGSRHTGGPGSTPAADGGEAVPPFVCNRPFSPVVFRQLYKQGRPDLRAETCFPDYKGLPGSKLDTDRMHPSMRAATGGLLRYTPAYEALVPRVRRVGIEDDVSLLTPGEYHADTSPLVQLLRRGHHGVRLDAEAWDRLVTWIDLNAPCHGTWGEVFPIPDGMHGRRMALRKIVGGPADDPEAIPLSVPYDATPVGAGGRASPRAAAAWPFDAGEARRRQAALGRPRETFDLGGGETLELVALPGGRFVMGDAMGAENERPPTAVEVAPFHMAVCEISNAQFARFDPAHDSGRYVKRHETDDDEGLPLNRPEQPVLRVSWERATAFCRWLSERTGRRFALPTEAQWEWAARAGSDGWQPREWVSPEAVGRCANVADARFTGAIRGTTRVTGGLEHLLLDGEVPQPQVVDDGAVVTAPVGSYLPNAWGLHDLAGNGAEWTRSAAAPYPYAEVKQDEERCRAPLVTAVQMAESGVRAASGIPRDAAFADVRRVVRGGSFYEPPNRCGPAARLDYPAWQRVFNVGFRVVCE
jgi:formylglycine-generating enzyme required for sulfatase activity